MNDRTDITDRETLTFVFERLLDASPDDAFDAWTQPEQVAAWWDPAGAPLVACTIDLRVGGAFRFEHASHGHPFAGTYSVVDRPHRLVFDAMGAAGAVTFHAEGAGTRVRVSITSPSKEHFETFLNVGVKDGTSRTLDNLVAHARRRRG